MRPPRTSLSWACIALAFGLLLHSSLGLVAAVKWVHRDSRGVTLAPSLNLVNRTLWLTCSELDAPNYHLPGLIEAPTTLPQTGWFTLFGHPESLEPEEEWDVLEPAGACPFDVYGLGEISIPTSFLVMLLLAGAWAANRLCPLRIQAGIVGYAVCAYLSLSFATTYLEPGSARSASLSRGPGHTGYLYLTGTTLELARISQVRHASGLPLPDGSVNQWWSNARFPRTPTVALGPITFSRAAYDPALGWRLCCPAAVPASLLALPVVARLFIAAVRRRLAARRDPNLCPRCGYDLRATPARCPECGRVDPLARSWPMTPLDVRQAA